MAGETEFCAIHQVDPIPLAIRRKADCISHGCNLTQKYVRGIGDQYRLSWAGNTGRLGNITRRETGILDRGMVTII
jgi:hypothetical protein